MISILWYRLKYESDAYISGLNGKTKWVGKNGMSLWAGFSLEVNL